MNKIVKTAAIAASACLMSVATANAALVTAYTTDFNAPTYSDGTIVSSANTTSPGQGGWINTSGTTNLIPVSNTAINGFATVTATGQDIRHPFASVSGAGNSAYLKADITLTAVQSGDYFLHFGDGGTSNFYARIYAKSSGAGYVMAMGTSSGTANYGTTVLSLGTTYTLLARYDFVSGAANDTGALFIDPTTVDGSGDTPYVTATTVGTDATSIAGVYLRQGGGSSGPTLYVDNITVLVPEPTTLAGLGVAGLIARRRRAAK